MLTYLSSLLNCGSLTLLFLIQMPKTLLRQEEAPTMAISLPPSTVRKRLQQETPVSHTSSAPAPQRHEVPRPKLLETEDPDGLFARRSLIPLGGRHLFWLPKVAVYWLPTSLRLTLPPSGSW